MTINVFVMPRNEFSVKGERYVDRNHSTRHPGPDVAGGAADLGAQRQLGLWSERGAWLDRAGPRRAVAHGTNLNPQSRGLILLLQNIGEGRAGVPL